ncbi:2-phosphosulfolactate phosphatase [Ammoniphilus sp. CFH 90114]|uniref:2-phosphosulfolactate phosphatase n=1 Tax=Ammoniphilus sp. CFH 90114 TaxID=2493665 RepID=UPI00100F7113|nr:2-phosphosulfolactate phosphatase [Ammoniphilus sp. CFH 90114]RXT13771.1 2-phosphosulfolactate phosphatase [Ammoniphilus sp. CFH 90114]
MKIDVVSQVDELKMDEIKNRTVIVIDVLRASSTVVTALAHGADEVIPVETVGQARQFQGSRYLLAGERYGKRILGFPFSNSPTEMCTAPLSESSLVLTTTNGTRAIQKSLKADSVLIGSFLNGKACAELAGKFRRDVTILCAGSRQHFALEDGLAAGYILSLLLQQFPDAITNDLGQAMFAAYEYHKDHLTNTLQETATGKRLLQAGNLADIQFCSQIDIYPFVPFLKAESLTIFTSKEEQVEK